MKKIPMLLLASLVISLQFARAEVPETYNGVRCKTREGRGDAYAAIFKGQPLGLFWIANDRVEVLANDLTEKDDVIHAIDLHGRGEYLFDFGHGTFTLTDPNGKIVTHYVGMSCMLCPAEMDHCPNS